MTAPRATMAGGRAALGALMLATLLALAARGGGFVRAQEATPDPLQPFRASSDLASLQGHILIDGSSTVWPITAMMAMQFRDLAPAVITDTQISGTTGGFRRFCFGESDLQNASRTITDAEAAECAANGVAYHAFEIGTDGITVVVNPDITFTDCLTVDQLRQLWRPGSTVQSWRDLDPAWPDEAIALFGPGSSSGTFDYFTEAIMGQTDASRGDYIASEDDQVLVQGVASNPFALGYFGYAYYAQNRSEL
jgi:phosphate transport system substrate-binding protein